MASHSLAIAKASLAANLIRPDPTSISKAEIAHFHTLLEAVLKQCSSANIQLCKDWLLKNIVPSTARTTAIGKYLVALSTSFAKIADQDDQKPARSAAPSGRRRQLHILYLLNDLFHHTKYHIDSPRASSILIENLQPYLVDLFGAVSAYGLEVYVKQHKLVTDLLDIWEEKSYFQPSYNQRLRDTVSKASRISYANRDEDKILSEEASSEEKKDAPYILPSFHGDPLTPYYDLPAGNMMPHIIPNLTRPVNPLSVKAMQLTAGPADENLIVAVKDFLKDVDWLDGHVFEDRVDDMDIDEMGQCVLGDEIASNITDGEGYYGWSRAFCKKMKDRVGLGDVGRAVGLTGSMGRSLSPRKRRRYSDSGSSRSWDSTMDNSRSRSSSIHDSRRRNGQRSSSKPRASSAGHRRCRSLRSRSQSRSLSYSPPQTGPIFHRPPLQANTRLMQQAQAQGLPPPPSMPLPHPFSKGFPLGPGGVPIPPPPPPNYHGPWPPPPPAIPKSNNGNAAATMVPLTGPKVGQNYGAPASERFLPSGFQGQALQDFGGWGQQQFGHVSEYPQGDRGGAQQSFNRDVQNSRGRGYGRGGWTR